MKLHSFRRYFRWLNVPTVSLLALLQRSPAVQTVQVAEKFVLNSPLGEMLKSAVAVAASLGAINTVVGATPLVPSSGAASGTTVNVGDTLNIAFTVSPTQTPIQSWTITGAIAPGLNFSGRTTTGTVNVTSLLLGGTATTAGTYTAHLQVFDQVNGGGFSSAVYDYTVTVNGAAATAPAITTQPLSQTVTAGANVTFTVAASGTPAPTLQWRKDGNAIAGETGTSLVLNNVQTTAAGTYTAVATNSAGSATSSGAVLTVNAATGPAPDAPTSLGAFASSATEVTLTWLRAAGGSTATGYKLERATNSAFTAGAVSTTLASTATSYVDGTATAGTTYFYRVSATNAGGASTASSAVQVSTPANNGSGTAAFANIATRAMCGTGNNVTIGGFVISGPVKKRVLVRAVGPSLTAQGLSANEVLADPTIDVFDAIHGNTKVATNDNIGDNTNVAEITTVGNSVGAAALLGSDTKSAALLVLLDPGVYSFVVKGKNDSSGVVLLEVYDADATATGTNFANIATRAYCTTNNGVTIGGFVVSGSAHKHVLMRAVGPTLTTQGIGQAEVLLDPAIELHDAIHGNVLIASNDNAGDNANLADIRTVGNRIGATPLSQTDATSSALLLNLPPGVYSFIARGKTAAPSGIVLVEVYDAD